MKISIDNAEHYVWGNACDGWHLVNHPNLSVIRERLPPGAAEVRHLHRNARQFFFVLTGAALLELDGSSVSVMPGEGIEVPPGVPHTIANPGSEILEILLVSQPHSHGDRVPA